jgi:hypothetical protein
MEQPARGLASSQARYAWLPETCSTSVMSPNDSSQLWENCKPQLLPADERFTPAKLTLPARGSSKSSFNS